MGMLTTKEYETIAENLTFNTKALINGKLVEARNGKTFDTVNHFSEGDMTTPFGGFKQSGFMGRDKSIWANKQYTELKSVYITKAK